MIAASSRRGRVVQPRQEHDRDGRAGWAPAGVFPLPRSRSTRTCSPACSWKAGNLPAGFPGAGLEAEVPHPPGAEGLHLGGSEVPPQAGGGVEGARYGEGGRGGRAGRFGLGRSR
eukprot:3166365-Prymnesium_polylepis.1